MWYEKSWGTSAFTNTFLCLFGDTYDLPDTYPIFTKLQLVEMRDMLNINSRFLLCGGCSGAKM